MGIFKEYAQLLVLNELYPVNQQRDVASSIRCTFLKVRKRRINTIPRKAEMVEAWGIEPQSTT
jgi:hypothetical protein